MAPGGDVKNQGEVHQVRKQKQHEWETGTNLVKTPFGEQGSDCDHTGAHKGLAQVGGVMRRGRAEVVWRGFDYVGTTRGS